MQSLTIRAPFNTLLGYGHASFQIAKELDSTHLLSIFPITQDFRITTQDSHLIKKWNETLLDNFDRNSTCLTIWHEFQLVNNHIGNGKFVCYPFWELNKLDKYRQWNMSNTDQLIVSSQWAKDVVENSNIKTPVQIAP